MGGKTGGIIGAILTVAAVVTGNAWLLAAGRAMVASFVISTLSGALSKKPSAAGSTMSAQGRLESVRQPLGPRQVIYGRCRVGGTLTFFATSGNNRYALMVVTLSGHHCNNIRDIYFNDLSSLDYGAAGAFTDAGGRFASGGEVYAHLQRSLGDHGASQPFSDLVAQNVGWTNDHLQRDCGKLYTLLVHSNEVWQTGLPQISAVIDGVNDIYDPRQGSPTWTGWTNNPALAIAHYLTASYGLAADYATEINEAALIAAANVCDERVTLSGNRTATVSSVDTSGDFIELVAGEPHVDYGDGLRFTAGSPGSIPGGLTEGVTYYAIPTFEGDRTTGQRFQLATSHANAIAGIAIDLTSAGSGGVVATFYDEPRYRINGAFALSEKPMAVIERMLMSMAGKLVNSGGVWYLYAGAYSAPTLTFDEDDFAGPIEIQTNVSRRDNANGVKGTFVDPSNRYQPVDFPPVTSATYLSEDGGERVWRDLSLTSFVTSGTQAQRLAKIDLISTRLGLTVVARFKLSAFRMLTGTTVSISNTQLGWSSKAFEVMNCTLVFESDGRIEVDAILRETAAEIYDWETSEEQLATIAPNTNLPDPTSVEAPTGLAAAQSTTVWDTVELSCTAPDDIFVEKYQFEYRLIEPGSPQDGEWTVMPRVDDPYIEIPRLLARSYQFRVLAINIFGATSDYADIVELTLLPPMGNWSGSLSGAGSLRNIGTIDTLDAPRGIGWSPQTNELYICCSGQIAIHNAVTGAFIEAVDNGCGSPQQTLTVMVYCPTNGKFYCAPESGNFLVVFDPATRGVSTIATTTAPARGGAYCPSNDSIYFACALELAVIDCATDTKSADIGDVNGGSDGSACYCPVDGFIYASDQAASPDAIDLVNPATNAVVASISLGALAPTSSNRARDLVYCPVDERIYCCIAGTPSDTGRVAIIDPYTQALEANVLLDGGASPSVNTSVNHIIFCRDSGLIYVTDSISDHVFAVSPLSREALQSIDVGANATTLLWVPTSKVMLVANNRTPGVVTRFSF